METKLQLENNGMTCVHRVRKVQKELQARQEPMASRYVNMQSIHLF